MSDLAKDARDTAATAMGDLAERIAAKLAEPAFAEMKARLNVNINWPRYLPVQLVRPTAVSHWIVRTPSGQEFLLSDEDWSAALADPPA
jgi:hypothetical protein